MDLYQIWLRASCHRPNQLCRIFSQSWVSILWGVKVRHHPHALTWPVAVNTVLALPRSLWCLPMCQWCAASSRRCHGQVSCTMYTHSCFSRQILWSTGLFGGHRSEDIKSECFVLKELYIDCFTSTVTPKRVISVANKVSKNKSTRAVEYGYHFWKCADAFYQKLSKLVYACWNYSLPKCRRSKQVTDGADWQSDERKKRPGMTLIENVVIFVPEHERRRSSVRLTCELHVVSSFDNDLWTIVHDMWPFTSCKYKRNEQIKCTT